MADPLIRGAVVLRARRYGVVWATVDLRGVAGLVLLPIIEPRTPWAYDVPMAIDEQVAAAVPLPRATVRPRLSEPMPSQGHVVTGHLPGRTMCRVVHQLLRAGAEIAAHDKWAKGLPRSRFHPDMEKPVKLVS